MTPTREQLNKFDRGQLLEIASVVGKKLPASYSRVRIIDTLCDYLRDEPYSWLRNTPEYDLRLLDDLVSVGPEKPRYIDNLNMPSVLRTLGIIQSEVEQDSQYDKVWISKEVYNGVKPHIRRALEEGEDSQRFNLERMVMGYLNIFGVVRYSSLAGFIVNEDTRMISIFSSDPLIKILSFRQDGIIMFSSPCLDDVDYVLKTRERIVPRRKLRTLHGIKEVVDAASYNPYFFPACDSFEGKELKAAYEEAGYRGLDLMRACHDTWLESQYTEESAPDLFGPLYNAPNANDISQERWLELCNIVCDYADAVPKWILKGHTAAKTGLCLADRNAWQTYEEIS